MNVSISNEQMKQSVELLLCVAGTSLQYHPGMLCGGRVQHTCNSQRSIGYYLEVLLSLAPFTKEPLQATLSGVTNNQSDPSVSFLGLDICVCQN